MKLKDEVQEMAIDLQVFAADYQEPISLFEALQIAVSIQRNRILSEAFVVGSGKPSALEAIAMELGAASDGSSIKDAIYSLNDGK